MLNKQKINKLMMHCSSQEDCDSCVLDDICIGSFWSETDENIDEMYRKITKTSVTDNLTGVVKEHKKTITEIFEEIKSNICDNYCKYPSEITDYDEMMGSCKKDHYRMKEQDLKRMSMMEMLLQDKTMTKMLEARE